MKLREKEVAEETIASVMELLKENHFVDDKAYAERAVEMEYSKGHGPLRIRQDLIKKGLSPAYIQEAMNHMGNDETVEEASDDLFLRKAVEISRTIWAQQDKPKELDEKLKAKILRRLASQGYTAGMAYKALAIVCKEAKL